MLQTAGPNDFTQKLKKQKKKSSWIEIESLGSKVKQVEANLFGCFLFVKVDHSGVDKGFEK